MIYLDSAATSYYRPREVAQAVYDAILTMGNAGRGSHTSSLNSARMIYETRCLLNELFHGPGPEQVVFTSNATEALNIAIQGLTAPGVRMAATAMDHNSVLRPVYLAKERGCSLQILDVDEKGRLSLEKLEELFQNGVDIFACTHASNVTGNLNPLTEIGKLCKKYGVLFLLDASQTAGVFPIDMERDFIDILCFTGHKGLMGPQGTGGLYVRQGVKINPLKVGGSGIHSFDHDHPKAMPEHLEAGTLNVHGIAGLGGALNYLSEIGTEAIIKKERSLIKRLEDQIRDLQNIHLYGNPDSSQRVGILSFNMGDEDSAYVADWLFEEEEIAVRSGAHCAPLMHETLGTKMQGAVRISVSHKNTEEEIDRTANAIKKLSQLLE